MNRKNFDVIIIGAGSVGAPAAFFLAQEGIRTLVIDKLPSVGQGANKAAIGGIRATHSDKAKISICLKSIEIFSTWEEEYGDHIGWVQGGYSFVAYREQDEETLKGLLDIQKQYGLNINWLGRDELLEVIPDLNPEGLRGGTFCPDDGSACPLLAAHAFYRKAREQGVEFHFNEEVTDIIVKADRVRGVKTTKGEHGTDFVINAAGPWARKVANMAGLDVPVRSDSHEAGITEPVERFLGPMVVDIRPAEGSANYYFYQHYTNQIVFCITPNPNMWGEDTRETSVFLPMVARRMIDLMPRLANLRVRRVWRGLYPMTPDGAPIVGKVKELEGYINAVGMCGQGFMIGPGLAPYLVKMVKDELSAEDREVLSGLTLYRDFGGEERLK
jgi:sarcosine oxidase subunit beta